VGPCHHGMARPQVANEGTASSVDGSCEYVKKKSRRQSTGGGLPAWALGEVLRTSHHKNCHVTNHSQLPRTGWTGYSWLRIGTSGGPL